MVRTKFRAHPGEVLLYDFLGPRGLTPDRAAKDIGMGRRTFNDIVNGKRPLNAEASLRLGKYFGISERFWLRLQLDYEMSMERAQLGSRLDKVAVLEEAR